MEREEGVFFNADQCKELAKLQDIIRALVIRHKDLKASSASDSDEGSELYGQDTQMMKSLDDLEVWMHRVMGYYFNNGKVIDTNVSV